MKEIIIAPSILSANFSNLSKELDDIFDAGAKFLHFDVMDGHFVPNLSFGPHVLKTINKDHRLFNDVHLMVEEPMKFFDSFIDAGADLLTFHIEICEDLTKAKEYIDYVHAKGCKVGISIKPKTEVKEIEPLLKDLDLVLVMSVEPGFGGQKFMPSAIDKIAKLNELRIKNSYKYLIEVDGGINDETAKSCKKAGVDVLVAGSYIFNSQNKEEVIRLLKED